MSKRKPSRNEYFIKKKSNHYEELNERKYKKSLERSGLNLKMQERIVNEIGGIENYFSTKELHKATYKAILNHSKLFAANYNIKQAIYNLGPTGYPFEILCAQMLEAKGYITKVSCMVRGINVKHEVDIIAKREDQNIYCECKFHGQKLYRNDIKIPLYVHSRYLDIKAANPHLNFRYALLSNTDFSKDAIRYAKGVDLLLYSMNYPQKNTFCNIIKTYKVYPVTVLKSLRVKDRKALIENRIVVIKQVKRSDLESLGLKESQIIKVLQEIKVLTRPN
jgi:hypothetical protein